MNLGELLKIVLKKGNFLFLCRAAPCVIGVHLSALHNKENTRIKSNKTEEESRITSQNPSIRTTSVIPTGLCVH